MQAVAASDSGRAAAVEASGSQGTRRPAAIKIVRSALALLTALRGVEPVFGVNQAVSDTALEDNAATEAGVARCARTWCEQRRAAHTRVEYSDDNVYVTDSSP